MAFCKNVFTELSSLLKSMNYMEYKHEMLLVFSSYCVQLSFYKKSPFSFISSFLDRSHHSLVTFGCS